MALEEIVHEWHDDDNSRGRCIECETREALDEASHEGSGKMGRREESVEQAEEA